MSVQRGVESVDNAIGMQATRGLASGRTEEYLIREHRGCSRPRQSSNGLNQQMAELGRTDDY